MKVFGVLLGLLMLSEGYGQSDVSPVMIQVSFHKTVAIIFPFAIRDVDYGSAGVIVQQRAGAKNILHIKAAQENFAQTSLSVVTSDGAYYSFVVNYAADVERLTYVLGEEASNRLPEHNRSQRQAGDEWRAVKHAPSLLHRRSRRQLLTLALHGIYQGRERLWFRWTLHNSAVIAFPIAFVKCSLKDKRRAKRRAMEEKALTPLTIDYSSTLAGQATGTIIAAFAPFDCPAGKRLVIQLGDADGNRLVTLRIPAKLMLRAKPL